MYNTHLQMGTWHEVTSRLIPTALNTFDGGSTPLDFYLENLMSSERTDGSSNMVQSTTPTTPIEMEEQNPDNIMVETMAGMSETWSYL